MRDHVSDPERPWRFASDAVMGGVSTGEGYAGGGIVHLRGQVSTANRGGFIQMRTDLAAPLPDGLAGVELRVRGNGERYYVHLRSRAARAPWQFYQAGFETGAAWSTIRLPFAAFQPQGGLPRPGPRPAEITGIGLAAYGRDHAAWLEAAALRFY